MKNLIQILSIGFCLGISSLPAGNLQAEEGKHPGVFARVNGTPLSMNLYHFLLGSREQQSMERQAYEDGFDAAMHRQQTAEDLVMTELLAQQATRSGMHETEAVQVEMAIAEKTLLAQLYVKKLMDSIEIDESEIRNYYDQQNEQIMYRFMIWQTPDQQRAGEILSALRAGEDAGVSDQHITETPWLRNIDIAPEVNELVQQLDVNEFADKPVLQDDLWKIVQVIDKQVMTKQSYDEEKEMIRAELVSIKLDQQFEELARSASIVFTDPQMTSPAK